jgi:putative ABC transport system permease protein
MEFHSRTFPRIGDDMSQPNDTKPPKWLLRFLRFFVKKEYLEEIEGDMEELFHDNVEQKPYRRAKSMYTWEIIKLLRPILIKKLGGIHPIHLNQYGMYKNYFKISIRGLMKNPITSFINLFGLAIAIGFSILVYGFSHWNYSMDQFHKNKNEVYLATFFAKRDGTVQEFGLTPKPLGEMLKKDFAQIKNVCRVEDENVVLKYENKVFHERIRYADPEFLEMFTFPLKWGFSKSLQDLSSIILSEKMSVKYFGKENPVGQRIQMIFENGRSKSFKITGVAEEFPEAHTIAFDFLINFENFRVPETGFDLHDWNKFVNATLIQVDHPSDLMAIEQGMEKYRILHNAAAPADWAISYFAFEPLATLAKRAGAIRESISSGTDETSVMFLTMVGGFMLVLACINYINIAIVSAAKRLKEIGVRKSIGATRKTITVQFLSENIITTFFALILGFIFGIFVVIPWFEDFNHFSMGFTLKDATLWIYLPALLLFTGIASGLYPSLYISKFQVVEILKGSIKFGKKNPLTKLFLVFQLILACIFITMAVMGTQNISYLAKRSWGYNERQTLYVSLPDQSSFEKLNALMLQDPDVLSISGSRDHLGKNNTTAVIHLPDHQFEVDQLSVQANYFETMGLQLAAGRLFEDHLETDKKTLVVNELFVQSLGLKNPIGQEFKIDSVQYRLIGIVNDFHSYSFFTKMKPTIFRVADKGSYRYLSLKVRPGTENKTYKSIQARWSELFPEIPFEGGYQEDVWGDYYEQMGRGASALRVVASVAILLVSLGLYGLVKLNVTGRVREFSIRKVLGAGIRDIAYHITTQYLVLLSFAVVAGAPLSYVLVKLFFDTFFTYHVSISYFGVAIAVAILLLVVVITVSTQIRKVLKSNPVNGLKAE